MLSQNGWLMPGGQPPGVVGEGTISAEGLRITSPAGSIKRRVVRSRLGSSYDESRASDSRTSLRPLAGEGSRLRGAVMAFIIWGL